MFMLPNLRGLPLGCIKLNPRKCLTQTAFYYSLQVRKQRDSSQSTVPWWSQYGKVLFSVLEDGGRRLAEALFGSVAHRQHVNMLVHTSYVQGSKNGKKKTAHRRRSQYYSELKLTSGQLRGPSAHVLSSSLAQIGSQKGPRGKTHLARHYQVKHIVGCLFAKKSTFLPCFCPFSFPLIAFSSLI